MTKKTLPSDGEHIDLFLLAGQVASDLYEEVVGEVPVGVRRKLEPHIQTYLKACEQMLQNDPEFDTPECFFLAASVALAHLHAMFVENNPHLQNRNPTSIRISTSGDMELTPEQIGIAAGKQLAKLIKRQETQGF